MQFSRQAASLYQMKGHVGLSRFAAQWGQKGTLIFHKMKAINEVEKNREVAVERMQQRLEEARPGLAEHLWHRNPGEP